MAIYDDPSGLVRYDSGFYYDGYVPPLRERLEEMSQIQLNLNTMTDAEIVQFARDVHTDLTDNPNVPTPKPSLVDFLSKITAAEAATNAYSLEKDIMAIKKNDRDNAMQALCDALRTEAATVQSATEGDADKIITTGFAIKARPTPVGTPEQVKSLELKSSDDEGEIDAGWLPAYGARSYEVQSSPDPITPASWTHRVTVVRAAASVNSFTSGSKVWIRVRGIGTAGPGAWSDPAVKTVP